MTNVVIHVQVWSQHVYTNWQYWSLLQWYSNIVLNLMNWFIRWFINSIITWWVSCHMQGVHIIKAHMCWCLDAWGSKQHYFWLVYQYIQFNSYSNHDNALIESLHTRTPQCKGLQLQAVRVTSSNASASISTCTIVQSGWVPTLTWCLQLYTVWDELAWCVALNLTVREHWCHK